MNYRYNSYDSKMSESINLNSNDNFDGYQYYATNVIFDIMSMPIGGNISKDLVVIISSNQDMTCPFDRELECNDFDCQYHLKII